MADDEDFATLIQRIRDGDPEAAQALIRIYEPAIRREARFRLGPSLWPIFDSMDLCQSVLGSFFARTIAGQYTLESPNHVMRLLIGMTRNKVREKARKRRELSLSEAEPQSRESDPTEHVSTQDFVTEFCHRLSPEELALWERRRRDLSWSIIATELGGTPESLRQQYSRAIRRVAIELGLEEVA